MAPQTYVNHSSTGVTYEGQCAPCGGTGLVERKQDLRVVVTTCDTCKGCGRVTVRPFSAVNDGTSISEA